MSRMSPAPAAGTTAAEGRPAPGRAGTASEGSRPGLAGRPSVAYTPKVPGSAVLVAPGIDARSKRPRASPGAGRPNAARRPRDALRDRTRPDATAPARSVGAVPRRAGALSRGRPDLARQPRPRRPRQHARFGGLDKGPPARPARHPDDG